MQANEKNKLPSPYAILGAGQLLANLWKTGDERSGWHYRFNIYRISRSSGQVTQLFRPSDVSDLVRLCQVLAATLADDGCTATDIHCELADLSLKLDAITTCKRA